MKQLLECVECEWLGSKEDLIETEDGLMCPSGSIYRPNDCNSYRFNVCEDSVDREDEEVVDFKMEKSGKSK